MEPEEKAPVQRNVSGIVVDDGSVREPILNNHGEEIGVFYFRPTDVGILERYRKLALDMDKIIEPLRGLNVRRDGTVDENNDAEVEALRKAQDLLFAACNEFFGGNFAEAFFGKMNPFSPVNGHFYCENALNAVGAYISRMFDKELERINARDQDAERRVGKYTQGYTSRTGKHKNGKKRKRGRK